MWIQKPDFINVSAANIATDSISNLHLWHTLRSFKWEFKTTSLYYLISTLFFAYNYVPKLSCQCYNSSTYSLASALWASVCHDRYLSSFAISTMYLIHFFIAHSYQSISPTIDTSIHTYIFIQKCIQLFCASIHEISYHFLQLHA